MDPLEILEVLSQSPFFLGLIDRAGCLIWSSTFAYGVEPPDVVNKPADLLILPEDRAAWWDAFQRARDAREVVRYTVRLRVPEHPGVARIAGRTAPVIGPGGRVTAVMTITFDSTCRAHESCLGCQAPRPDCGPQQAHAAPSALPMAGTPVSGTPHAAGRKVSPLEARILAGLAGKGWIATARLAEAIGEEPGSTFRAIVGNLGEAGVIETCQRRGLRLPEGG